MVLGATWTKFYSHLTNAFLYCTMVKVMRLPSTMEGSNGWKYTFKGISVVSINNDGKRWGLA